MKNKKIILRNLIFVVAAPNFILFDCKKCFITIQKYKKDLRPALKIGKKNIIAKIISFISKRKQQS